MIQDWSIGLATCQLFWHGYILLLEEIRQVRVAKCVIVRITPVRFASFDYAKG